MKKWRKLLPIVAAVLVLAIGAAQLAKPRQTPQDTQQLPAFSDQAYVPVQGNIPAFTQEELVTQSYELYSELDALGRCGYAMACIGVDIMPTEDRGSIGQVKPSGWQTVKYDFVDGKYLYNRCHLIGFQLTGENANPRNLITGTRYLNIEGMLPFENMVADYVKETGNHVLYRVTPVYEGQNLLASGVRLEGKSVEDDGEGICFHVYAYNCQPGVVIDYATGESYAENAAGATQSPESKTYICNKSSKKFHAADCPLAEDIKQENKESITADRQTLLEKGYSPCKSCEP